MQLAISNKAFRPLIVTPCFSFFYRQALPSLLQENENGRRERNEQRFHTQCALLSLYTSPTWNVTYLYIAPRADTYTLLRSSYLHNRNHNHNRFVVAQNWASSVVVPRHLLVSVGSLTIPPPSLPLLPRSTTRKARSYPRLSCEALSAELSVAIHNRLERCRMRRERFKGIQEGLEKHRKVLERRIRKECKSSIRSYTTSKYRVINKTLREGAIAKPSKSVQKDIRGIVQGFRIALSGFKTVLRPYEGRDNGDDCLYRGSGPIPEEPVAGGIFSDKAFFSTSSNKQIAEAFSLTQAQDKPRYLFKISKYSTGVSIKQFSSDSHKHEEEILFPPSTWFRVVSVDPEHSVGTVGGTVTLVELEEMA